MLQKLDDVAKGQEVWRGQGLLLAHPSTHSRGLCGKLRNYLSAKEMDHPLLLVGRYLNPLFWSMEYILGTRQRAKYRSKAEDFTRKLLRKEKEKTGIQNVDMGPIEVDEDCPTESNMDDIGGILDSSQSRRVVGLKRTFETMARADTQPRNVQRLDEIWLYNFLQLGHSTEERKKFVEEDFAVVRFWYLREQQLPNLFAISARIYATPVSSPSSERVFSVLKLLVDDKRSNIRSWLIQDMIVIRSLYE